ncbi:MAG: hypothetical protein GQ531_10040 [Sulfurovum sp.]|nr:hypothetical protein [Sulfurovum sp.]
MDMIMKALKVFWGIFALLLVVKIVVGIAPTSLNFSFVDGIMTKITEAKEDRLTFALEARKGMVLSTIKGCIKEHNAGIYERGYSYGTQGQCMNGLCSLTVEFNQEIPKKVQLYVQKNAACVLQTFEVPKTLETIGYQVNLQLSQIQKEHLGIKQDDKIILEHSNGYSFSGKDRFYYYDAALTEDMLSVNDAVLTSVYFTQKSK